MTKPEAPLWKTPKFWLAMVFIAIILIAAVTSAKGQATVFPNYQPPGSLFTQTTSTVQASVYTPDTVHYTLVLKSVGPNTQLSTPMPIAGNADVNYTNPQDVLFYTDTLIPGGLYHDTVYVYRTSTMQFMGAFPLDPYQLPQTPVQFTLGPRTVIPTPTSALVKVPVTTNGYPVKVTVYYGPSFLPSTPDTVTGQDTARVNLFGLTPSTVNLYYVRATPINTPGINPQQTPVASFITPGLTTAYAQSVLAQSVGIDSMRIRAGIGFGTNPSPQIRFVLTDSTGTNIVAQSNWMTAPADGDTSKLFQGLDPYTKYGYYLLINDNGTIMSVMQYQRTHQVPAPTIAATLIGQPTKHSALFSFSITSNDPTGQWLPNSLTKAWADIGILPSAYVTDFDTVTVPNTLTATVLFDTLNAATTYFAHFRARNKGGAPDIMIPFTTAAPFAAPMVAMGEVLANPTSFVVQNVGYTVATGDTSKLYAIMKNVLNGIIDTVYIGILTGSGSLDPLIPNRQALTPYQIMFRAKNSDGVWGGMTSFSQSYTTLEYGQPNLLTEPYQVYGTSIAIRVMGSTGGHDVKTRITINRMSDFMQVAQSPVLAVVPMGLSNMVIDDTITLGNLELNTYYRATTELLDAVTPTQQYTQHSFEFTTAATAIAELAYDPRATIVWTAYSILGQPIAKGTRKELSSKLEKGTLYVLRSGDLYDKILILE